MLYCKVLFNFNKFQSMYQMFESCKYNKYRTFCILIDDRLDRSEGNEIILKYIWYLNA